MALDTDIDMDDIVSFVVLLLPMLSAGVSPNGERFRDELIVIVVCWDDISLYDSIISRIRWLPSAMVER